MTTNNTQDVPLLFPTVPEESEYARGFNAGLRAATYNTATHEIVPKQGWIRVVDEALVTAGELGVANASDDYETARAKLRILIDWHVAVATDPQVNGGYVLVPVVPTKELWSSFSAYDGTSYSDPFSEDCFREDWAKAVSSMATTHVQHAHELVPLGTREAVEKVIAEMITGSEELLRQGGEVDAEMIGREEREWADRIEAELVKVPEPVL